VPKEAYYSGGFDLLIFHCSAAGPNRNTRSCHQKRVGCLLVLDLVTSTPQWIRQYTPVHPSS
jgi:hypothetical protein